MPNKQRQLKKDENGKVYIHKGKHVGFGIPPTFHRVMSAHDNIVLSFPFLLGV